MLQGYYDKYLLTHNPADLNVLLQLPTVGFNSIRF